MSRLSTFSQRVQKLEPEPAVLSRKEWVELRTLIVTALDEFPEAKEAVVSALLRRREAPRGTAQNANRER
jgi:hypothetical protein